MDTGLLLLSSSLVGLSGFAAGLGVEVIRHIESRAGEHRDAGGRIHLAAPSAWQSVVV